MSDPENVRPAEETKNLDLGLPKLTSDSPDELSIFWESEHDPQNPRNWSAKRRWGILAILSFLTFVISLASSMLAPGVPTIIRDLGSSSDSLATFVVSIFVLGFAVGPMVLAPLSELYGRAIIYNVSNVLFLIFTVACGLSTSMNIMLVAFRFFAGLAGSAAVSLPPATIADLMPVETRGKAISIWGFGPLIGPVIGPVCSGFLIEALGWRWVFWVISIVFGVTTIASFFLLKETYGPYILERKAARLRKETSNPGYHSRLQRKGTPRELVLAAVIRPAHMFIRAPIVTSMSLYLGLIYGVAYMLFSTFAFVFHDAYGFGPSAAGLTYIATGVGEIISLAYIGVLSDRKIRMKKAAGIEPEPEDRLALYITVPGVLLFPAGMFMYGWTAQAGAHWILPMIATGIAGFGLMVLFLTIAVYLTDCYPFHAASAMAANACVRGLMGALLPLCALQMYEKLGLGWGNTMLGFIALAMAPLPVIFKRYGKRIRTSKRFFSDF